MRRGQENQALGRAPLSARIRVGPDPRISIRARGVFEPHTEAEHTTAPDHMSYLPKTSCIHWGVHTRPVDRHAGRGLVGVKLKQKLNQSLR